MISPLPDNEVIKIDNAGFGFVLMHKSIVPKIREANPGKGMFMETGDGEDDHFIGEDIIFFCCQSISCNVIYLTFYNSVMFRTLIV